MTTLTNDQRNSAQEQKVPPFSRGKLLIDREIKAYAEKYDMVRPFSDRLNSQGMISWGLSSMGYDIRVADEYKVFTNVWNTVVDPKDFDAKSFVDFKGPVCIVPPNSFALARTVEYFKIPRNVLTICCGKCLTGDTRVVDAQSGDYLTLKEFVSKQESTTLSLEGWRLRPSQVSAHINNGVQPVYELTTRAGLKVKATATHPFRVFGEWKSLADLRAGDRIAVARSLPIFGKNDWPEHEATLLGLLLSGGQCRTKNKAALWLEKLGCNVRSKERFIPSVVFTARRERVAAFLRALFSGDGSAYGGARAPRLEYGTISQRLAEEVRHLLLRFGIFCRIRRRRAWTGELAYRVETTDREMIRRFAQEIGFIPGSQKQEALDDLLTLMDLFPEHKSNFDTLPSVAGGLRHTQPDPSLPYEVATQVAQSIEDVEFSKLVESDVVWDTVKSIVPAGEEVVYDLTVPSTHNFVANDIVVHNSTYARCGIIVNVTPFEPEWEGFAVLEISNTTPLPAKIYSNEGIAQVLFFASEEPCEVSYADRKGKYQKQQSIVLPKI